MFEGKVRAWRPKRNCTVYRVILLIIGLGALSLGSFLYVLGHVSSTEEITSTEETIPENLWSRCFFNSSGTAVNTSLSHCGANNQGQCDEVEGPRDSKHPSHVFYSRGCSCKVCLETYHTPENATNVDIDGNLPPCFTGTSQNYDWWTTDQCTALTSSSETAVEEYVVACLTPSRTCCNKRVL